MAFDSADYEPQPSYFQLMVPGNPDIEDIRLIITMILDMEPTIAYKVGPVHPDGSRCPILCLEAESLPDPRTIPVPPKDHCLYFIKREEK